MMMLLRQGYETLIPEEISDDHDDHFSDSSVVENVEDTRKI